MFFGAPLARRQEAGAAEVFIGAQRGRACVLPVPDGLLLSLEEKGLQSFMVTLEQLDSNMPTDTGPEDRPSEFSLLFWNRKQQNSEAERSSGCRSGGGRSLSGRGCGS